MKLKQINPPVYLFFAIAIMVLLRFLLPGPSILPLPWNLLGLLPLALGIVLNLSADSSLKKYRTTVKPLERTTVLITDGVFRVSRHPMYLGFVLILVGIAMLTVTLTPFIVVMVFAIFMDIVFVVFEEKKLEQEFGKSWIDYRKNVRRWI